ncbi:NADP oxidoreductase [Capnocytophaga sp. HP1101]
MKNTQKIAVIGLGNIGKAVAENLNKGGRPFIVAGCDLAKTTETAKAWQNAEVATIDAAVKEADIIIPAVWFATIAEFMAQYAADLKGKIIVDVSNPIAPNENGGFKKIIAPEASAGEINASKLPEGAYLAKTLGTLGEASLRNEAFATPRKVLFYATDEQSINPAVEQLIKDCGFEPVRVGGLNQSIRIEVFGDLHEFGALGKTITLDEAKQLAN